MSAYEMRNSDDLCGIDAKLFEDANGFKKYIGEGVIE
jgi:hypothetical protein